MAASRSAQAGPPDGTKAGMNWPPAFGDIQNIQRFIEQATALRLVVAGKEVLTSGNCYERIVYLCSPQGKKA